MNKKPNDPMKGLTLREGARRAGFSFNLGFENVWIDGIPMKGGQARDLMRKKLLLAIQSK